MAKFCGNIGFGIEVETSPGVTVHRIIEKKRVGDLLKFSRKDENSGYIIDNVVLQNKVSIIADPFVNNNLESILYVEIRGTKWKISSIDVEYPRLILTLGGVYHES